jgi:hypothetical protein
MRSLAELNAEYTKFILRLGELTHKIEHEIPDAVADMKTEISTLVLKIANLKKEAVAQKPAGLEAGEVALTPATKENQ